MKEKLNFRRLLLATGLFVILLAQGCGDLHNSAKVIEVENASEFVVEHADAVILDVRRPTEYEKSHITGSVNLPVQDESFADKVAELDPSKKYIVHCSDNKFARWTIRRYQVSAAHNLMASKRKRMRHDAAIRRSLASR